jgi:adenosylmethionine-8-amino-7-oxononanoate aminotransferase
MSAPERPDWSETGFRHIWLPYSQMQTAPRPFEAVRTEGVRVHLAEGRVLIDGVSSWWLVIQLHREPDHLVALLRQKRSRDRRVDSAGHGDDDAHISPALS